MTKIGKCRQSGKEGNTSLPSPPKQETRKTFYCFTLFNYEEIEFEANRQLQTICSKYLYGRETCPTTGNTHLQGFIHLKKPMRLTELKIIGKPHFEPCKGSEEQNTKYCSKEGDVMKWGYPIEKSDYKELYDLIEPTYDWQIEILDILKSKANCRDIYWYWSHNGGVGKSQFCKYLHAMHDSVYYTVGKGSDINYLIAQTDMEKSRSIIVDIARKRGNKINYEALEDIKTGLIFSSKYETVNKMFKPPHIFCFANFPPVDDAYSDGRIIIKEIVQD